MPCKILLQIKNKKKYERYLHAKFTNISLPVSLASLLGVFWLLPESSVSESGMIRIRMGKQ
jgi:hypothetical protein